MRFKTKAFKLSALIVAMTVVSTGVNAVDFGVPADDNPFVPGIDAEAILTDLATTYTDAGNLFAITAGPNDAGMLNGEQYGPVAFGGVPGGATGWINSSYAIPSSGTYRLAFWVSDVGDTIVDSALAFDNVQFGTSTFSDFSSLPSGWESFGSNGSSPSITGVSPTVGSNFGFIDTQNNGALTMGVGTSAFGGTVGSLMLSSEFTVSSHDAEVSFDANFLSNDGAGFNDFAVVQLFSASSLSVTEMMGPGTTFGPGDAIPPDALVVFGYDYLVASGVIEGTDADSLAYEEFLDTQLPIDGTEPMMEDVLAALIEEYSIVEDDLISYVSSTLSDAELGGDGGIIIGEGGEGGEVPLPTTQVSYDFDNAVTLFTADSADPLDGLSPDIPILPGELEPGDGIWVFPEIPVVPDVTWWFDPEYATGYDYTVNASNAFTSIELPVGAAGGSDNCYNLIVDNTVIHDCSTGDGLLGGIAHDLTDLGDINELTITGIEIEEQLDPNDVYAFNTGFQFKLAGNIIVTQAPITTFVPDATSVPEPGTLFLMSAGILGFAGYRRKQTKQIKV